MNKKALRNWSIILALLLVAAFAVVIYMDYQEQEKIRLRYEQMNQELLPIQEEIHTLRSELAALDAKYKDEKKDYTTIQIVFSAPISDIYTSAYPFMEEYDFVGVVAISPTYFPGMEGCISVNEAKVLEEAGWQFCMRYDGSSFEELQAMAVEAGIKLQNAVYFTNGAYDSHLDIVGWADYVIHHGEGNRPLITSNKEDKWYLGAVAWFTMGVSDILSEAVSGGANIVYTIGPDGAEETYESSQFKKMMQKLTKYEDVLVTNLTDLERYQGNQAAEDYEINYQKRKQEIQEQINALQEQERAIYAGYENG